jgi:prepilin-type processing-associated H-X9-DG protein
MMAVGMMMYANDNKGNFPSGDNIKGIQKIIKPYFRKQKKILLCPDDKKSKIGQIDNLQEKNSSYIYLDIEKNMNKIRRPSYTILIFDKPGNHKGSINVLYMDGHVAKIKTDNNYSCEAILRTLYKNKFSNPIYKLQLEKAKEMDKKFGWKVPKKKSNLK